MQENSKRQDCLSGVQQSNLCPRAALGAPWGHRDGGYGSASLLALAAPSINAWAAACGAINAFPREVCWKEQNDGIIKAGKDL